MGEFQKNFGERHEYEQPEGRVIGYGSIVVAHYADDPHLPLIFQLCAKDEDYSTVLSAAEPGIRKLPHESGLCRDLIGKYIGEQATYEADGGDNLTVTIERIIDGYDTEAQLDALHYVKQAWKELID